MCLVTPTNRLIQLLGFLATCVQVHLYVKSRRDGLALFNCLPLIYESKAKCLEVRGRPRCGLSVAMCPLQSAPDLPVGTNGLRCALGPSSDGRPLACRWSGWAASCSWLEEGVSTATTAPAVEAPWTNNVCRANSRATVVAPREQDMTAVETVRPGEFRGSFPFAKASERFAPLEGCGARARRNAAPHLRQAACTRSAGLWMADLGPRQEGMMRRHIRQVYGSFVCGKRKRRKVPDEQFVRSNARTPVFGIVWHITNVAQSERVVNSNYLS